MKWMLLILVFLGFFGSTNCNEETFNENRIIGGEETPHGLFLFLTKLWIRDDMRYEFQEVHSGLSFNEIKSECSSTIISKRHIITDAHCVVDSGVGQINHNSPVFVDIRPMENMTRVVDDETSMKQFGIPSKVYIHRGYNGVLKYNDIAILEFPEYIDFEIPPVKLAKDYVDNYNDTAIAAGYGLYKYDPATKLVLKEGSPTLRHVKVGIHPFNPNCISNEYLSDPKMTKVFKILVNAQHKICAGNIPLQRTDHGDSGGPLLYRINNTIYQIGLCESGFDDPENNVKPGIFTRISSYCGWIEMVTKNEVKCEPLPKLPPIAEKLKDENKKGDAMALKHFCVLLFICALNLFII